MNGERLAPWPCDFCKAEAAPFGYAPAPRLGIPVRRQIKTCAAPGCKAQTGARVADLVARHDPLAVTRLERSASPKIASAQGNLFSG